MIFRMLFQMDELQRENIQQKQEISELRCGSDTLALELKSSQDSVLQLEQQLQQKEELVCYDVVTMVPTHNNMIECMIHDMCQSCVSLCCSLCCMLIWYLYCTQTCSYRIVLTISINTSRSSYIAIYT